MVLPMFSALTAAPIWKVIGWVFTRFDESPTPAVSLPSSAVSTTPGRLIRVTTVLSGWINLMTKSPTHVCAMPSVTLSEVTFAGQPVTVGTTTGTHPIVAMVPT